MVARAIASALFAMTVVVCPVCGAASYSEHLVIHDVTRDYSAATFVASASGSLSEHQQSFPGSIATLFDTYPLQAFKLTLSRGRWRRDWCGSSELRVYASLCTMRTVCVWAFNVHLPSTDLKFTPHVCRGAAIGASPPSGATFAATWLPVVTPAQSVVLWTGFANAVSGLFCSSLSTLVPSTMHQRPSLASPWGPFTPPDTTRAALGTLQAAAAISGEPRQSTSGLLSQEAVCTENLTGFVKLLPCRDRGGLGALLQPQAVFGSPFHTLELQAKLAENGAPLFCRLLSLCTPTTAATAIHGTKHFH